MRRTIFTKTTLAGLACGLILLAGTARAGDVQQILNMGAGKNWTMVNDGASSPKNYFDDGKAGHSGADYFVGRNRSGAVPSGLTAGTGIGIRPPAEVDATFPGDSLTIDTDGSLVLKPKGGVATTNCTVSNLTVKGTGLISQASNAKGDANTTATLSGRLTLADTPSIKISDIYDRILILDSEIGGSGVLTLNLAPSNQTPVGTRKVIIQNNANTFSGSIVQNHGFFTIGNTKALGNTHNLTVNAPGKLLATTNVNASATTLTLNTTATLVLSTQVNFGNCIINGKQLANGTYKASDLQTSFEANITNAGGSLIVGPAPNAVRNAWLFN
jgi:hypothetical protein